MSNPLPCSEVAGLVLIDPAFESLFDSDNAHDNKWADYWYNHTLSHMRAVHLSASLGLNRLALMVGLMPPVEDPELNRILPEDIITRKVGRCPYDGWLIER